MTKLTNKNIFKNQSSIANKMRAISLATFIVASVFTSMTFIQSQNAYAITCPLNGQNLPRCYAQHNFSQGTTGAYNGMQSTQKVLYHTISAGTWLQSSNWAIHPSGDFVEIGWHQNGGSGTVPFFICGVNGGATTFGPTPSDNTYYVLKSEDLNLDKTWVLS